MAKRAPREGEGRPTHYNDEILSKAEEYLANYESHGDAVPSHAGLALVVGISRFTVYEWAKHPEKKEFSSILDKILMTQEKAALSKGLTGDWNAQIVKLLLGKHGYSDKVETQATVTFEQMSDDELAARIAAFQQ